MQTVLQERISSVTSGWCSLHGGIIDRLVAILKRTRRWRRDGRSLRQLNKHWCLQLSQHIVAIHPDGSRSVTSMEASKLIKFPRLTSLNATAFFEPPMDSPKEVGNVISQLRHLSHLEVSPYGLVEMGRHLTAMAGVTSLATKVGVLNAVDLEIASRLPVRRLACLCCSRELQQMMSWFPALRHLDAYAFDACDYQTPNLKALSGLESFKLALRGNLKTLDFLADITSLVSLRLHPTGRINVEGLSTLPLLRSLELKSPETRWENMVEGSLVQTASLLSSLSLTSSYSGFAMPRTLLEQMTNLQSLTLKHAYLPDNRVMNNMCRLTSLEMIDSVWPLGQIELLSSLQHLRRLLLHNIHPNLRPNEVPLDHATLPQLEDLDIDVIRNNQQWTHAIGRLTKLERLSIRYARWDLNSSASDLGVELDGLVNLRSFKIGNSPICTGTGWKSILSMWTELESLYFLPFNKNNIEAICDEISTAFPHLKLYVL